MIYPLTAVASIIDTSQVDQPGTWPIDHHRVNNTLIRQAPIAALESEELTKKPHDEKVHLIVDDSGRQVGLTKAQFADLIYEESEAFAKLDRSSFAPIFNIIKDIMAHDE